MTKTNVFCLNVDIFIKQINIIFSTRYNIQYIMYVLYYAMNENSHVAKKLV